MESLGHDCWQVVLHFGFKNDPDVPERCSCWKAAASPLDRHGHQLLPQPRHRHPHLRRAWRCGARSCSPACTATPPARPTSCTCPANRIVELGTKVEIRRWWPRYAVPGVLALGLAVAALGGAIDTSRLQGGWAQPVFVAPQFSVAALVGLALPLFVVTMASQNLPGVAAQRAAGVTAPISPVIGATGLTGLLLAPFGGYAFNLAAITAAICMGREAHEDPARRWLAAAAAGGFYLLLGLAGAAVVGLFAALPKALVLGVAALALLGAIGNGLAAGMKSEAERDAAVLTFLVTLSGVQLAGIGAPFWAVLVGLLALGFSRR
jgi:benzoate transporter